MRVYDFIADVAGFVLVVGIGSTVVLDLWCLLLEKISGRSGTRWGIVGRWLLGLAKGQFFLRASDIPPSTGETALGWIFHYLVGLAYAAMLPLFWGADFVSHPALLPFVIIGFAVSTLAGLLILTPGLGGGFLALKTPDPLKAIGGMIAAHIVFALAQGVFALLVGVLL